MVLVSLRALALLLSERWILLLMHLAATVEEEEDWDGEERRDRKVAKRLIGVASPPPLLHPLSTMDGRNANTLVCPAGKNARTANY